MIEIWVVSYYDKDITITTFDNESTAREYYEYISSIYDIVSIDKCPVYSEFWVNLTDEARFV